MILQSLSTATIDLNRSASAKETTEISKSNFIFAPCMGQNGVFWNSLVEELLQLLGLGVQEPHCTVGARRVTRETGPFSLRQREPRKKAV